MGNYRGDTMTIPSSSDKLNDQFADLDLSRISKFAKKGGDVLFGYIEKSQAESSSPSFGRFLDAGTGSHSLRWIASVIHREHLLTDSLGDAAPLVSLESYSAITADEVMMRRVIEEAESLGIADKGDVLIGNWKDGVDKNGNIEFDSDAGGKKLLLEGREFDTILADYLVGAVDGFSPYFQDLIIQRLVPHLAPGGRLYIIGLQPIPDNVQGDADVFCRITKVRDACIKLANHRCYREYPVDWIERHVRRAGLRVVETRQYPIRYDHATMLRQINVGRSKLKLFPSKGLADEMGKVLDSLEKESKEVTAKQADGRITLGFDYVVVAERPRES
ncbi:predicted protein [Thalassiosira pseudonana CCMP1335]|uniref:Methyltransferase type 11 domain-containing protein n=1 Tax=Thalassiosira pseudonana TaxID=35128 RepID=B8CFP8_THAPS|nr:predicted protein [Thalassiosira pseudonana CCMP1335]EED87838.1 predicted protein [Thalassiosira pseudonana CCMP1335]|eukprot:g8919.t1 g8919   contig34:437445-438440(+)